MEVAWPPPRVRTRGAGEGAYISGTRHKEHGAHGIVASMAAAAIDGSVFLPRSSAARLGFWIGLNALSRSISIAKQGV